MYKFISWNVNGLRAVCGKGFADIFTELDADFFCLQETKLQAGQIDLEFLGYKSYWNYADKKGYSGTAIFTKHEPISVTYGLGIDQHDHEGRVITLEMEDFYLVCVYTPNSQDGLKRLDYRMEWDDDFRRHVYDLSQKKGVVICGDLNVAHRDYDLANPQTNHYNPGFTDEERGMFTTLLNVGFIDTLVIQIPGPTEERRLAYRLLPRIGEHARKTQRRSHPHRNLRIGPLPCGAYYRVGKEPPGSDNKFTPVRLAFHQLLQA